MATRAVRRIEKAKVTESRLLRDVIAFRQRFTMGSRSFRDLGEIIERAKKALPKAR